jgi:hypothetical protein
MKTGILFKGILARCTRAIIRMKLLLRIGKKDNAGRDSSGYIAVNTDRFSGII